MAIAILAVVLIASTIALVIASRPPSSQLRTQTSADRTPSPSPPTVSPTAAASAVLPNSNLTPGVASADVTPTNIASTICVSGYTSGRRHDNGRTVRPPESYTESLKRQQISQYGYTDVALGDYEEDHLIPLEVGGDGYAAGNLWPEPYAGTGARVKDQLENRLHSLVCSGKVGLLEAQRAIAQNWYAAYRQYVLGQS
jgi:hypothetical protein